MKKVILRVVANWSLALLPVSRLYSLKRRLLNLAGVQVADGGLVNGGTQFLGRGNVAIGAQTWIGPNCRFYTHSDASISVGDRCDIAPEVSFVTGSHAFGSSERRAGVGYATPIHIGKGCWIGTRATILGGVRIGEGSIVAAGSVVTRDVPENSLVGGVPARLIRHLKISGE